jgi:hypothetical protein
MPAHTFLLSTVRAGARQALVLRSFAAGRPLLKAASRVHSTATLGMLW